MGIQNCGCRDSSQQGTLDSTLPAAAESAKSTRANVRLVVTNTFFFSNGLRSSKRYTFILESE